MDPEFWRRTTFSTISYGTFKNTFSIMNIGESSISPIKKCSILIHRDHRDWRWFLGQKRVLFHFAKGATFLISCPHLVIRIIVWKNMPILTRSFFIPNTTRVLTPSDPAKNWLGLQNNWIYKNFRAGFGCRRKPLDSLLHSLTPCLCWFLHGDTKWTTPRLGGPERTSGDGETEREVGKNWA